MCSKRKEATLDITERYLLCVCVSVRQCQVTAQKLHYVWICIKRRVKKDQKDLPQLFCSKMIITITLHHLICKITPQATPLLPFLCIQVSAWENTDLHWEKYHRNCIWIKAALRLQENRVLSLFNVFMLCDATVHNMTLCLSYVLMISV